jgi:hypothetical protein
MAQGPPKGNQFWKLRSKHGKDALFTDPEKLWSAACEYFEWADKNKLIAIEFHGKDAYQCEVPKMRAFTMKGLCLYLNCNTHYFSEFKARVVKKKDAVSKRFLEVITQIEDTVYVQKFEGAAAGFLSASIIGRELGLAELQKVDANIDANVKANVTGKVTVVHKTSGIPLGSTPTDGE